jgi:predicted transposase YbfD/YdcC
MPTASAWGKLRSTPRATRSRRSPKLLKILELSGCLVTVDAIACQTEIARQIVDAGADYVLAVK